MALNLTPCVYPLLPITVSYFAGRTGGRGSTLAHGLCYIGGLALVNSLLGVVAALTGRLMGAALRHPAVLVGVAGVLLFFAASLFGLWEMRLPAALSRSASRSFGGYLGSVFMGLTMGVVAAPCIGPFVLGLLTWVAGTGSALFGFAVFLTLSLGLGLPLLALALFSSRLDHLPRAGDWMVWVRRLMGWVLVGMAVYFVRPVLSPDLGLGLLAAALLAAAVDLGWRFGGGSDTRTFRRLRRGIGALGVLLALVLVGNRLLRGPGVTWQDFPAGSAVAARDRKPMIVDFSADWCTPCRRLEEETFHDPGVVELAGTSFVMVKVDLTRGGDPEQERLVREHAVQGVPTVVFFDRGGRELAALRLVDFIPPGDFLARMRYALEAP